MALIPIRVYKNSVGATLLSIFGGGMLFGGIVCMFEEFAAGLIIAIIGGGMFFSAEKVAKNKAFKLWVKGLREKGVEAQMANSYQVARMVYDANPCKKTLEYIRKHNVHAAEEISKTIVK